jgi:hypothetical protein
MAQVYSEPSAIAMVMELVDGGDLFEGIVASPDGHMTEQFAAQLWQYMA